MAKKAAKRGGPRKASSSSKKQTTAPALAQEPSPAPSVVSEIQAPVSVDAEPLPVMAAPVQSAARPPQL
ncbi:hypothetical protein HDU96_003574 [Phlyctochytrium bullatum]|nr:hypothetical protein HDU96_003574 [Phlyctochytrium bullatum]